MARKAYEIEINRETSREDLEFCAQSADRTSDVNTQRAAAQAKAELWRRKQLVWAERFNAESAERIKAQQFQAAQAEKQIEAQKGLMHQQLEVAKEQAEAAKSAAEAAQQSAKATVALVVVTAILAVIGVATLFFA